jgi:hypothetical protein
MMFESPATATEHLISKEGVYGWLVETLRHAIEDRHELPETLCGSGESGPQPPH